MQILTSQFIKYSNFLKFSLLINSQQFRFVVLHVLGNERAWIGLNDIQNEGSFVWMDGEPFITGDMIWLQGEPNDHNNEDCIQINWDQQNTANDGQCSESFYGLCEKQLHY